MPETQQMPPVFGRYKDPVMLGSGGMGAVYRAVDPMLDRYVAIKVLTHREPRYVERFRREAQVLAKIVHPSIIQIYEIVGTDEDQADPYIVMEFFEGRALDTVVKDGPLPERQVVSILRQAAEGLKRAHDNNVVHRDIKPANLMLSDSGAVKILDFGIAKLRDAKKDLTGQTVLGTPYYMSPEQALGHPIDPRTDIYSLGITAFHLLTGRRPFEAKAKVDVMLAQVKTQLPDIGALAQVDARVQQVVEKMCAKKADARYQDTEELVEALDDLPRSLGGKQHENAQTVQVPPPKSPAQQPARSARVSRPPSQPPKKTPHVGVAVAGAVGGAALVLAGVGFFALRPGKSSQSGRVPTHGWVTNGELRKIQKPGGYANCIFSGSEIDAKEEDVPTRLSFAAGEPIFARCFFPRAIGSNKRGEVWQELWVDGQKRAQTLYDSIPAGEESIGLALSREQAQRLSELSSGKHTLDLWIYRQTGDSDAEPLAAGELVVRK
jgi:serine/threonine protein kinase